MKSGKSDSLNSKSSHGDNAEIYTNCFASAALAINSLHGGTLGPSSIMKNLIESSEQIASGSLKEIEQMLITQAKALDYMFYETLKKLPDLNMVNQIQVFADIALKAQNQSRKTLSALADIKHPKRTTFVKQQNNAINQQVNNGGKTGSTKKKKMPNELLEKKHEQRLDRRTQKITVSENTPVEAMEKSRS